MHLFIIPFVGIKTMLYVALSAVIEGHCIEIIILNESMNVIDLYCMNSSSTGPVGCQHFKTLPNHHIHFVLYSALLMNCCLFSEKVNTE